MDFLKNNAKTALVAAAGAAALIGGIFYFANKDEEDDDQSSTKKIKVNHEYLDKIKEKIETDNKLNILTRDSMKLIYDAQIEVGQPRALEMTKEFRENSRANYDNVEAYCKLFSEYSDLLITLSQDCLDIVLESLEISRDFWERSDEYHAKIDPEYEEKFDPENVFISLKDCMKPSQELNVEQVMQVLDLQNQLQQEEITKFAKYAVHMKDLEVLVTPLIMNRIYDKIQEELGYEEEDVIAALKKFEDHKEIGRLLQRNRQMNNSLDMVVDSYVSQKP